MNPKTKRIWISLAIYSVWIVITLFGARLIADGETALDELVSTGIGWHFAGAIAVLLAAIWGFNWSDIGFNKPRALFSTLWFPSIYLVLFTAGIAKVGAPPLHVIAFVAINTLMVGASEEIMFRGVLFRAFDKTLSIWPAIIVTSVLFGAVHTLNVFITGELAPAIMQSIAAGMSGLIFMAILIRTGSIWPAIIYHFLWDCLIFLASVGAASTEIDTTIEDPGTIALFGPILLNLPNMLFAILLLRNIGKEHSGVENQLPT